MLKESGEFWGIIIFIVFMIGAIVYVEIHDNIRIEPSAVYVPAK